MLYSLEVCTSFVKLYVHTGSIKLIVRDLWNNILLPVLLQNEQFSSW